MKKAGWKLLVVWCVFSTALFASCKGDDTGGGLPELNNPGTEQTIDDIVKLTVVTTVEKVCCEDEDLPFALGTLTIRNESSASDIEWSFEEGELGADEKEGTLGPGEETTLIISVIACGSEFLEADLHASEVKEEGEEGLSGTFPVSVWNRCHLLRDALDRLTEDSTDEDVLRDALHACLYGAEVDHSSDDNPALIPMLKYTEITWRGSIARGMTEAVNERAFGNTDYPCGEGEYGYTVCPINDEYELSGGDHVFAFQVNDEEIPLDDSEHHFQFGFVFDEDGDPSNNYTPSSAYPNDFFSDTDRWYSVSHTPAGDWYIDVQDAQGAITDAGSAARAIITGNTILLVVPADEFTVIPDYRVTAFAHHGDYGMGADEYWSGDVEPRVADGLAETLTDSK